MITKVSSVTEKKYTNAPRITRKQSGIFAFKALPSPQKVLTVTAGTIILSTLGLGALIMKRIIDNTNPHKK